MTRKDDKIEFLEFLDRKGLLYPSEKDELAKLKTLDAHVTKEIARKKAIKEYQDKKKNKK